MERDSIFMQFSKSYYMIVIFFLIYTVNRNVNVSEIFGLQLIQNLPIKSSHFDGTCIYVSLGFMKISFLEITLLSKI